MEKEVLIEKDTGARTKSHPNEIKIRRKSSFRITSVIDTDNAEEEEPEADSEEDIKEPTVAPEITPDSMVTYESIEKLMISTLVSQEKGSGDSNPR